MTDERYTDADEVVRKIEDIEIQGATSIAEAGVTLLKNLKEGGASASKIDEVADRLRRTRPTEPFLFNSIRVAREDGYCDVLQHIRNGVENVASNWSEVLSDGDTVYTHCHSSTATSLIEEASRNIDLGCRVTETRPLYQGRETAAELSGMDLSVDFFVDSGGLMALEQADVMIIGCDAVFESGECVNKIGSRMFSWIASQLDVPVFVATDSWKYDPGPGLAGKREIETRSPDEVWSDAPPGVDIKNKAFEAISPEYIEGVVSELGVHPPGRFVEEVEHEYPQISGVN